MKVMGYNAIAHPCYGSYGDFWYIEVEGKIIGRYLDHPFTVHCYFNLYWDISNPITITGVTDSIKALFNKVASPERQFGLDRLCGSPRFKAWEGQRGDSTSEVSFFLPETAPDDVLIERGKQIIDGLADDVVCLKIMFDKGHDDEVTIEGDDVVINIPSCDLKVTFKGGLTQERLTYFIEHISDYVNSSFEYEDIIIEYPEPSEINAFTCDPLTDVIKLANAFLSNKAKSERHKKVVLS